jgi:hypothetical protein
MISASGLGSGAPRFHSQANHTGGHADRRCSGEHMADVAQHTGTVEAWQPDRGPAHFIQLSDHLPYRVPTRSTQLHAPHTRTSQLGAKTHRETSNCVSIDR